MTAIRRQPVEWGESDLISVNTTSGTSYINLLDTLRFKADCGYDLRMFTIAARNIELPARQREFDGFGGTYTVGADVVKWPDSLRILTSTAGVRPPLIEKLPATVTTIGNNAGKPCVIDGGGKTTVTVPENWKEIRQSSIIPTGNIREIVIEGSGEPLDVSASEPVFQLDESHISTFNVIVERNIRFRDKDTRLFANKRKLNPDTVFFGPDVTEIPGVLLDLYSSVKLKFTSMTPPECETAAVHTIKKQTDSHLGLSVFWGMCLGRCPGTVDHIPDHLCRPAR